jgi:transposase
MADRDPRFKSALRRRAAKLYRGGKDVREVADALGVSPARAYILILEGGAKMRGRGPS